MSSNLPKDISDRVQKASSWLGESLTKEEGRTDLNLIVQAEIKNTHSPSMQQGEDFSSSGPTFTNDSQLQQESPRSHHLGTEEIKMVIYPIMN